MSQNTLLLIDDEQNILRALYRLLRSDGYNIITATNVTQAFDILEKNEVQVIISDERMPEMLGSEFMRQAQVKYRDTIRIILSGQADFHNIVDAMNQGAISQFIEKPWDDLDLRSRIQNAFQLYSDHQRQQQLRELLDNSLEGVLIFDEHGKIHQVNPTYLDLTHYESQEIIGEYIFDIEPFYQNLDFFKHQLNQVREKGQWTGEVWSTRKDGSRFPTQVLLNHFQSTKDDLNLYAHHFIDISKQKEQEQKIIFNHSHDPITGLYNRHFFYNHLQGLFNRGIVNHQDIVVLMLDLDRFSVINSTFGQDMGDKVMGAFAKRLQSWCETKSATAARLGGDEFAVVFCGPKINDQKEKLCQDLILEFQNPVDVNGQNFQIAICVGAASFPEDTEELDTLIKNAATALVRTKETGGNHYLIYSQALDNNELLAIELEADIYNALSNNEFCLHYQPFMDATSGRIVGFECLIRWNHPRHGLLYPDKFISLTESTGLIIPIGHWVIKECCQFIKKLEEGGINDIYGAVNLSPRQFDDHSLYPAILSTLQEQRIEPCKLELEITENLIIKNPADSLKVLQQLRNLGIRLALDDFGTGYSSLNQLKNFPFDILKIDRSFIRDSDNSTQDKALVNAIIAMGKSLNMKIIAEGVENPEQLDMLQRSSCDVIQGFLISKPLPEEDFILFVQEHAGAMRPAAEQPGTSPAPVAPGSTSLH